MLLGALGGGSATGTVSISPFVYGCAGAEYTASAGPVSTSLPRYITPIASAM